jgi:hypothetical protein
LLDRLHVLSLRANTVLGSEKTHEIHATRPEHVDGVLEPTGDAGGVGQEPDPRSSQPFEAFLVTEEAVETGLNARFHC